MSNLPIEQLAIDELKDTRTMSFPFNTFFYVLEGEILISMGNEYVPYLPSDLLFVPASWSLQAASADGRFLTLSLSDSFLRDCIDINPLPFLSSQLSSGGDYLPLKRSLLRTVELYRQFTQEEAPGRIETKLSLMGELYQLLACLTAFLSELQGRTTSGRYSDRVREIARYIDSHLSESFTLPDLAGAFFLTPQYLSTFFRESFSMNFKEYVTRRRLFFAERDLRGSAVSIHEIALKNGFSSVSAFQKNFRKFLGCTPSEYRENARKQLMQQKELPLPEEALSPSAPGLSIRLDAAAPARHLSHVNRMINAGSVHNLLSEQFRQRLRQFCLDMKIRYVRITELFSSSFMPIVLPHREFFYQNADIALTFFYENDLIPFIELTKLEAREPLLTGSHSEYNYILRNQRFFQLLESFLKHVSRRWPISWLKEWKFEMHLRPKDTTASYAEDFAKASDLIHTYIPGAALGGPGYEACVHSISLEKLLKMFTERKLRPDFFSVTLNYYENCGSSGISRNPELLTSQCAEYRKELQRFDPRLPLYVTEWSSVNLTAAPVSSSLYQAAFLAKTYAALDEVCSLAAYWLFENTEYIPGAPEIGFRQFGRGLFSQGSVPNAAYYAFALCAALGSEQISCGSSWRFVLSEENHYQLLAWNYVHFRASPDPESGDVMEFDRVYQLFEEVETLPFRAVLYDLQPGLYHCVRTVIDKDHGSVLDVIISEYTGSNIDRIEFLQHASGASSALRARRSEVSLPLERSQYIRIEGDTLSLSCELPPHTVCLWDVRRLI